MTNPNYTPIYVSQGFKRLVGGTVTETTGKDISADTFTIGLCASGTVPPAAGAFTTPTTNTVGPGIPLPNQYGVAIPSTAQRILLLLIDSNTPAGFWHAWARIPDSPEVEPVWLAGPFQVI